MTVETTGMKTHVVIKSYYANDNLKREGGLTNKNVYVLIFNAYIMSIFVKKKKKGGGGTKPETPPPPPPKKGQKKHYKNF